MKKNILLIFMLGLGMIMVSCNFSNSEKIDEPEPMVVEEPEQQVVEEPVDNTPRVYACAYDAYVNIREKPDYKAPILGVFRNGPDGAILLGTEGDWTKIDCNGIVGYVFSQYVQNTPTVAYIGTATIDDIAGLYYAPGGYGMYLWDDGTWESGYNDPTEGGKYILQNNEVKLLPAGKMDINTFEWEDYNDAVTEANSSILPIDLTHHKLGEWERQPFITKQEIDKWIKENREYYSYEISEHGEKWLKDNAVSLMREGTGSFPPLTKEEFKKKGR